MLVDSSDHAVGGVVTMQVSEADRERWRERVFGEVLPEGTADDRPDPGEVNPDERDRWLLDNRPPHHDTAW